MATPTSSSSSSSLCAPSFKLVGHTHAVFALAGHPFLPMLVSGASDATVRVWDLETCRCVRTLEEEPSNCVRVLAVDPAGRRLVSGSLDGTLRLWDLDSAVCVSVLRDRGTVGLCNALAWDCSGTLIASGSSEGDIRVWDPANAWAPHYDPLEGHSEWITAVVSHPASDLFASASDDGKIRVWRWSSGESVHTLEGHTDEAKALVASACFIVSASEDKTVRVWSWTSGLCVCRFFGFAGQLCSNSLAWRDSKLVVIDDSNMVRVWDTSSAENPGEWLYTRSMMSKTSFAYGVTLADGERLAGVADSDTKTIVIWGGQDLLRR